MDELISKRAAIDALWKALYEYEDKTEKQFQESEELDVADWFQHRIFVQNMSDIDRQTILNLPPAQPEILACGEGVLTQSVQDGLRLVQDCISRQAAVSRISDLLMLELKGRRLPTWDEVNEAINELPSAQPEQRWIPMTERLPKPYEYCLWTTTDGRVIYHHCDGLFSNYIAWMPLPEPYERSEE